jgi:hypothetical protein
VGGDPIVGTWVVTHFQAGIARYKYKYTCSAPSKPGLPGSVQWQDYWNEKENGSGTWTRSGGRINFKWPNSSTNSEYLILAPTVEGDKAAGEAHATYGDFVTIAERTDIIDPKQDFMEQWAANYGDFRSPYICPWAVPYILMLPPNTPRYRKDYVGRPITKVRGLAIHQTWSSVSFDDKKTVGACINTWNSAGVPTGAHFIIVNSGLLVQVVPTNRMAFAQGGTADSWWLSVEIQSFNTAANPQQIQAARFLFQWIANTHGCDKKLAKGFVGKHETQKNAEREAIAAQAEHDYNPITRSLCNSNVTTNVQDAVMSSGLSCHYWLHPTKYCPGKHLLRQMDQIA